MPTDAEAFLEVKIMMEAGVVLLLYFILFSIKRIFNQLIGQIFCQALEKFGSMGIALGAENRWHRNPSEVPVLIFSLRIHTLHFKVTFENETIGKRCFSIKVLPTLVCFLLS